MSQSTPPATAPASPSVAEIIRLFEQCAFARTRTDAAAKVAYDMAVRRVTRAITTLVSERDVALAEVRRMADVVEAAEAVATSREDRTVMVGPYGTKTDDFEDFVTVNSEAMSDLESSLDAYRTPIAAPPAAATEGEGGGR